MNLPNYFLADLPAEATLTPAIVADACRTLKQNRKKYLLSHSTKDLVELLCEAGARWLEPDNKFRRLALVGVQAATCPGAHTRKPEFQQNGFSMPVLKKGLDDFFRQFTSANFKALLEQEFGNAEAVSRADCRGTDLDSSGHPSPITRHAFFRSPEFLVHIAAGNIPNPTLMSMVLGLLTRSAQFVKCAGGASFLPRLFAHSIYELDPKVGACLEIAEWRGGSHELENVLFAEADCVTVTGSDETLANIRNRLPLKTRFVGYGQRVSFGFVAKEVLREDNVAATLARAADDVVAWDQNGCLSPHMIYVEDGGRTDPERFAQLLALELMNREPTHPRGTVSTGEAAAIASRRSIYEVLTAHRPDIKIWSSQDSTAWTVVFEHEARFQFSPLNRFIYVKPVADLAAALQGADEIRDKISTVGLAASGTKYSELAMELARWGATRICPLGRMQDPPLTWRHDGRPALGDLVTWVDVEVNSSSAP